MSPEQLRAYGEEYGKLAEKILEKVTDQYLGNILIFEANSEAQRNALQCAMSTYHLEINKAARELEKTFS